jgi:hypothetical protein
MLSDRLPQKRPTAKYLLSAGYSLACAAALFLAFALPPGRPSLPRSASPCSSPAPRRVRPARWSPI